MIWQNKILSYKNQKQGKFFRLNYLFERTCNQIVFRKDGLLNTIFVEI